MGTRYKQVGSLSYLPPTIVYGAYMYKQKVYEQIAPTTISPPSKPSAALPTQLPTAPYDRVRRLEIAGNLGPAVGTPTPCPGGGLTGTAAS